MQVKYWAFNLLTSRRGPQSDLAPINLNCPRQRFFYFCKFVEKRLNRPITTLKKSMAKITPPSATLLLLLTLLMTTAPQPTHSSSFNQYRTLLSMSHSLLMRVSSLRAERGDISGSNRVKLISEKLERGMGLGFLRMAWSVGWDYVKNYAWREVDYRELYGAVSDLNQLMSWVSELTRVESEKGRARWIGQNYEKVLAVSKRLFVRVLQVFRQSGALREVVKTVEREVVEGGLLRDCLEIGSNDLKGLIEVVKDFVLQYYPSHSHSSEL